LYAKEKTIMTNKEEKASGTYLWRGGEKLNITKVPDRFAVRLKRGVSPVEVAATYHADHRRSLARQNLAEFAVDAAERDPTMDRVRREERVEFASHVYSFEADPTSRFYLTDEITVQFEPRVSDEEIESLTVELGLELVKEVAGAPRTYVFRVTSQAGENPIKIANRLLASGKVLVSEPNIAIATKRAHVPADSLFSYQWHLHHDGGPFLAADSHVDAVRAWDITRGERSVVVAVADDSVDLNHVDFQGADKIVAPVDFGGRDFEPLPGTVDDNHGTACAGVAVAEENGHGVVGVAPGCALIPIRTSGIIDDNSIEELCDWVVEHGASVVSCSWSAATNYFALTLRMRLALSRAATQGRSGLGCVLVFAAGNENRPLDGTVDEHDWPDDVPSGPTPWLNGFATHEDVIAVAACTSLAKKSAYSNWGDEISVCAPSNNAPPGTFPKVTTSLVGRGVVTTDRVGPSGYSSTDYTFGFGGTSSACPLVAGVAALVLSANPDLTAREVKEILQATADKIVDHDPDPQLGQSLGTYDDDGHSPWFGYGKVNAFRAVTEAVRRREAAGAQTFQAASTPALAIPDADAVGVRDTITFSEAAMVSSVKVHVDITHTYRGDLRLTLTAPSGASVVLHNRNGGRADNIRRTFDPTSTPGVSTLVGQSLQGDWTLHVQDLAPADLGRLNRWELEIEGRADAVVELEETPGVTIPDDDPSGIERTLATTATGQVKEVAVSVDITHTFIHDLSVALVSPSGTSVTLHHRTGGAVDNIITTYTPATTPGLQALRGEAIEGEWKLKIADLAGLDVGKLNQWALRIVRQP
jgi:subtilisin-like proprotein convertase family protein